MIFLVNLDDFFVVVCTGFHEGCGLHQIRSLVKDKPILLGSTNSKVHIGFDAIRVSDKDNCVSTYSSRRSTYLPVLFYVLGESLFKLLKKMLP